MKHTRPIKDLGTYYLVIARDTDMNGEPRCIHCGLRANDVHEILPRSFLGRYAEGILFAIDNRCCLCRECHNNLHNEKGRGKLLLIMHNKFGYEYKGRALCLLEEYLAEESW